MSNSNKVENVMLTTACGATRLIQVYRDKDGVLPKIEVPLIEALGQSRFAPAEGMNMPKVISASRRFRPFTVAYLPVVGNVYIYVEDGTYCNKQLDRNSNEQ